MFEIITTTLTYASIAVFIATILDVFFITGYIFYGFAMLSVVGVLITSGAATISEIIIAGSLGTYAGNILNFYIGKTFSTNRHIKRQLEHKRIDVIRSTLASRGLFILMFFCRFVTFLRPAYALLLGTVQTNTKRFLLYESIVSVVWVIFWTYMILNTSKLLLN